MIQTIQFLAMTTAQNNLAGVISSRVDQSTTIIEMKTQIGTATGSCVLALKTNSRDSSVNVRLTVTGGQTESSARTSE